MRKSNKKMEYLIKGRSTERLESQSSTLIKISEYLSSRNNTKFKEIQYLVMIYNLRTWIPLILSF